VVLLGGGWPGGGPGVVQGGGSLRCGHSCGRHVGQIQLQGFASVCLAAVQVESAERC
jgi:hypothetical protein